MVYNGSTYFFRKNILGDVTDIYNNAGTRVAGYAYDAWGNCTVLYNSSGLADINPFRYRGYYYDSETGFYYLNSRYYDPEIRRFINADDLELLPLLSQTVGQLNLYAYCNDNPIIFTQESISAENISGTSERPVIFNSVLASGSFRNGLLFGKGTVTKFYVSSQASAQVSLKNGKFVLGVSSKFSLLNANGQIGIGNDNFSISLKGSADIGTISALAGIIINPDSKTYFAGIDAKISAFAASGGVQFEIFDYQIEAGVSGNVLAAGVQFGVGIKDGEFYYRHGFAFLLGYDVYIKIKFA